MQRRYCSVRLLVQRYDLHADKGENLEGGSDIHRPQEMRRAKHRPGQSSESDVTQIPKRINACATRGLTRPHLPTGAAL